MGDLLGGLVGGLGGTNPGGTKKGLLEGAVKVEVQPSAVVVDPTIDIKPSAVIVTGNANPTVNISDNGSNNSVVVTDNANPVITGNANPTVVITDNFNPTNNGNNNGSNNSAEVVITDNANPSNNANNNGSNNNVVATNNANPSVVVTGNANGGLVGVGSSRKRNGQDENGDHLIDANVGVEGGSSDPRCVASLVGLGPPLIALIPLALAGQVGTPVFADVAKQAEDAFNNAAHQFIVEPAQLTAAGGAAAGVVAALLVTAAVRSCIPQVRGVDVSVGGSSRNDKPVETVAAPVVDTRKA